MKIYTNETIGYRWRKVDALEVVKRLYEYDKSGTYKYQLKAAKREDGRLVWEIKRATIL